MDYKDVTRYLTNVATRGQRVRKTLTGLFLISGSLNLILLHHLRQKSQEPCSEVDDDFMYNQHTSLTRPPPDVKTILYWNSVFHFDEDLPYFFGTGQAPFKEHCPVSNCFATIDKYLMKPKDFDAIIFFYPTLLGKDPPFTYSRSAKQSYVMFSEEAPFMIKGTKAEQLDNFFNLTMGYRKDSDIYWPYGVFEKLSLPGSGVDMNEALTATHRGPNFARGKKKLAAWFVSNCITTSKREMYIEQLQKLIPIDVYGQCGNLTCYNTEEEPHKCHNMVQSDYKFYLSFENSFCRDYVTEKLFDIMKMNVIPIVFGGANYSDIVPPHSYIDATKTTPKKLAALMQTLDANDTLYNEYFWWKPYYRIVTERKNLGPQAICKLCELLNSPQPVRQTYDDFVGWWDHPNHCHDEYFFPIRRFNFEGVDLSSVKPRQLT